jgi:cobaltochelatase CobS
MTLTDYLKENNLPDFLTSWQEVSELTGIELNDLPHNLNIGKKVVVSTVPDTITTVKETKPRQSENNDLATIIANAINPFLNVNKTAEIDENKVIELIKQHAPVKQIEVKTAQSVAVVNGLQHCQFEDVLFEFSLGHHVYLCGPAGTGKTQLAENAALALNKNFASISVCGQSSKSDLLGFINANGNYISTLFRDTYENGGVFLIDEIDNGNANVLNVLNAALTNCQCAFPDRMVKKHPDFLCVAAANTFGFGADRIYVGRVQLDAALLDRFELIEVNYDENLENALFGKIAGKIQAIRKKLINERCVISMRRIKSAAEYIAAGLSEDVAIQKAVINKLPSNLQKLAK